MMGIEYDYDKASVVGVEIKRPSAISAKQWIDYWERLCNLMEDDSKIIEAYDEEDE